MERPEGIKKIYSEDRMTACEVYLPILNLLVGGIISSNRRMEFKVIHVGGHIRLFYEKLPQSREPGSGKPRSK